MHRFHIDKNEGQLVIGYDIIIGRDLMVQLGLSAEFKRQVLEWDGVTVPMKETRGLIGQTDLTSREMSNVVMHNTEPASTR